MGKDCLKTFYSTGEMVSLESFLGARVMVETLGVKGK